MAAKPGVSSILIWLAVAGLVLVPVIIAGTSPFLAYRNPAYIVGGFAGIVGLSLLLLQPLLALRYLPGIRPAQSMRWHRWLGTAIVVCVAAHILGLYLTSSADTLDALLLVAPTPFSVYGVIAMWSVVATAILALLRSRLGLRYATWRILHNLLALIIVSATVVHAVEIEGAMGTVSKWVICLAVLTATSFALLDLHVLKPLRLKKKF